MNPPRTFPLFLAILMPVLILPLQAWSFPRSHDTLTSLASIHKCLDNYEHQLSQSGLERQPWLGIEAEETSKIPTSKYCKELLDYLFKNTLTPLDYISIAGSRVKSSEATKRSTKLPNDEKDRASSFDRLKYFDDDDENEVPTDDISSDQMFLEDEENQHRPVELSKLKGLIIGHKENSGDALSSTPQLNERTDVTNEKNAIEALNVFKTLYEDSSKNRIVSEENTKDKGNGFDAYRLADIPKAAHVERNRRSQLELEFPDDPLHHIPDRALKPASSSENGKITSSKRARISWPLIDMMQFAVAKRRRQTMSINNALMALTNMMLSKGRARLMKNRESLRHHMYVQG